MRILIDTQVFVWLSNDDSRLGTKALHTLSDIGNQLFISYFSLLEMTLKTSAGKLSFNPTVIDDLPAMDISVVMPGLDELREYRIHHSANKDPFDNILITSAMQNKLTLITADRKILAASLPAVAVLDAQL